MTLQRVRLNEIDWIAEAADRLSNWLINDCEGDTWTSENRSLPGIYRWTVSFITYEALFTEIWTEHWFQRGVQAFGLLALEREEKIACFDSDSGGLIIQTNDGTQFGLEAFLNGESLPIRHDPEFSDLCWDPVDAVGHILAEYEATEWHFDSDRAQEGRRQEAPTKKSTKE